MTGIIGAGNTVSNTVLILDGVTQTTLDVTGATATFQVTSVFDKDVQSVGIHFVDGTPSSSVTYEPLSLTPSLVSITPNRGSRGGTKVIVTATAIGTADDDADAGTQVLGL